MDHLIELVEVTIGLHFGVVIAAALDGISLPDTELVFGHDWPAYCEAILVGGGWLDTRLSIIADSAEITGSADRLVSVTELACLVPYIPSSITRLEATVSTIRGTRRVTLELGPARAHASSR